MNLKPNTTPITEGGIYNFQERRALNQEEIISLVPKEVKHKNGRPTVLEYKGNFYILDHTRLKK